MWGADFDWLENVDLFLGWYTGTLQRGLSRPINGAFYVSVLGVPICFAAPSLEDEETQETTTMGAAFALPFIPAMLETSRVIT
jgi:hypothetical protein